MDKEELELELRKLEAELSAKHQSLKNAFRNQRDGINSEIASLNKTKTELLKQIKDQQSQSGNSVVGASPAAAGGAGTTPAEEATKSEAEAKEKEAAAKAEAVTPVTDLNSKLFSFVNLEEILKQDLENAAKKAPGQQELDATAIINSLKQLPTSDKKSSATLIEKYGLALRTFLSRLDSVYDKLAASGMLNTEFVDDRNKRSKKTEYKHLVAKEDVKQDYFFQYKAGNIYEFGSLIPQTHSVSASANSAKVQLLDVQDLEEAGTLIDQMPLQCHWISRKSLLSNSGALSDALYYYVNIQVDAQLPFMKKSMAEKIDMLKFASSCQVTKRSFDSLEFDNDHSFTELMSAKIELNKDKAEAEAKAAAAEAEAKAAAETVKKAEAEAETLKADAAAKAEAAKADAAKADAAEAGLLSNTSKAVEEAEAAKADAEAAKAAKAEADKAVVAAADKVAEANKAANKAEEAKQAATTALDAFNTVDNGSMTLKIAEAIELYSTAYQSLVDSDSLVEKAKNFVDNLASEFDVDLSEESSNENTLKEFFNAMHIQSLHTSQKDFQAWQESALSVSQAISCNTSTADSIKNFLKSSKDNTGLMAIRTMHDALQLTNKKANDYAPHLEILTNDHDDSNSIDAIQQATNKIKACNTLSTVDACLRAGNAFPKEDLFSNFIDFASGRLDQIKIMHARVANICHNVNDRLYVEAGDRALHLKNMDAAETVEQAFLQSSHVFSPLDHTEHADRVNLLVPMLAEYAHEFVTTELG